MNQIKIGRFIASCRKEQGMTQAVLAGKLGISDRAVYKWETGKSMPDAGNMLGLCELLKIMSTSSCRVSESWQNPMINRQRKIFWK